METTCFSSINLIHILALIINTAFPHPISIGFPTILIHLHQLPDPDLHPKSFLDILEILADLTIQWSPNLAVHL